MRICACEAARGIVGAVLPPCSIVRHFRSLARLPNSLKPASSSLAFAHSPVGVAKLMSGAVTYLRRTLYLSMGLANGLGRLDSCMHIRYSVCLDNF